MNGTGREPCGHGEALAAGARPLVSALMFSAGLLGNLLALGLLLRCRRPPRARAPSLFHVLVLALVVTDLLGTCSVSPLVLASYHRNLTLNALGRGGHICLYFGFAMSFFGLATMLVLFAMALERCLALGRPYFYERFLSPRAGLVALPAIYTFSAAFCSLPLLGFGRYVQYCPGTWCFIQMRVDDGRHKAAGLHLTFSLLYATLLLFLILSVLLCNLSVIANLARMHRRGQRTRRLAALEQPRAVGGCSRRIFSMAEEIDHLLLLAIMTITFVICSLPFTICAYVNKFSQSENHDWDLLALRFLSINPIIDPWVFAILRPPVLRVLRSVLCCQLSPGRQDAQCPTPAKTKLEPSGQ
ncbi:prostaglandin E2 receptor EP2 subtype [Lagopus muta]|uniref:prostaglandin E2 receptor EP2 subtype n=1 Tax=Lagopus leucura TaxID=30410 RepID=UPI001C673920|nr:prostaglandin E2 receptor EP2 subtype [Lagopus leucura]XP_048805160.1 prostaglandin E2 receptor EP2 subtype [Lagopus muta]